MKRKESIEEKSEIKNVDKYGEMIPSTFNWMTLENQKRISNKLANIGKKDNNIKRNIKHK